MPRSGVGKTRAMLPWSLEAPGMIPSGCGEPEDGPDYLEGSCALRSEAEGSPKYTERRLCRRRIPANATQRGCSVCQLWREI